MKDVYARDAGVMRALSTPIRLQILDLLSCGEMCASAIQDCFSITQPTLSYHMKILVSVGIIEMRTEGKYVFYSLKPEIIRQFLHEIEGMFTEKENCICRTISKMPCMDNISGSE